MVAVIEEPSTIEKILCHLGRPPVSLSTAPARGQRCFELEDEPVTTGPKPSPGDERQHVCKTEISADGDRADGSGGDKIGRLIVLRLKDAQDMIEDTMPRALIQRRKDRLSGPTFTAADGLQQLGYQIEYFESESLLKGNVPLAQEDIVVAGVGVFFAALQQLGIAKPELTSMPDALLPFAKRQIREMSLGQARELNAPLFVKPKEDTKSFTGFVVNQSGNWSTTASLPNHTRVVVSDLVEFTAEFRCFVMRGEVIDVRRYSLQGDPLVFPDATLIREAVAAYIANAPVAFALDVGVLKNGETAVVEVNDAHSLGDYGLFPIMYARLLEARWCQLMGTTPVP